MQAAPHDPNSPAVPPGPAGAFAAEVGRSPQMDEVVAVHGVGEVYRHEAPIASHLEDVHFSGFTVLENVLTPARVAAIGDAIDRTYAQQMAELGGESVAEAIQDKNHVRCPLAYDDVFVDLALDEQLLAVMRGLLGPSFVLMMQNAVINPAGDKHYQTRWHRDLNYQHWTSSKPLAANALFCIDDFTVETGGTYVLPGTHLREAFPSDDYVRRHQQVVTAPAGSLILMDAMLFHRAGKNVSPRQRRAVNHVVGLPFMAQQIDIPAFVGDRLATDDFRRSYFGYRWRPAADAKAWRTAKLPAAGVAK